MAQVFVPYGESEQVVLPDGSKEWVDAGTLLVYPKDFTDTDTNGLPDRASILLCP